MYELSLVELESELSAVLPERNLMCHRKVVRRKKSCGCGHNGGNGGPSASYGSAAASNSTSQVNSNPQTFVNSGRISSGVNVTSFNRNTNTTQQNLQPVNIGLGVGGY
jgi:hypothetical protein